MHSVQITNEEYGLEGRPLVATMVIELDEYVTRVGFGVDVDDAVSDLQDISMPYAADPDAVIAELQRRGIVESGDRFGPVCEV